MTTKKRNVNIFVYEYINLKTEASVYTLYTFYMHILDALDTRQVHVILHCPVTHPGINCPFLAKIRSFDSLLVFLSVSFLKGSFYTVITTQ